MKDFKLVQKIYIEDVIYEIIIVHLEEYPTTLLSPKILNENNKDAEDSNTLYQICLGK